MGLREKARKAVDAIRPGQRGWLDELSPQQANDVKEVIEDYYAGKLPGFVSAAALARWLKSELKARSKTNTIARYVLEYRR